VVGYIDNQHRFEKRTIEKKRLERGPRTHRGAKDPLYAKSKFQNEDGEAIHRSKSAKANQTGSRLGGLGKWWKKKDEISIEEKTKRRGRWRSLEKKNTSYGQPYSQGHQAGVHGNEEVAWGWGLCQPPLWLSERGGGGGGGSRKV